MRKLISFGQLLFIFLLLVTFGCGEANQTRGKKVLFGAVLPLTGSAAQYGEEARQGIEVALEYIRSSQTGGKYDFTYEIQDSETNPRTAEAAFRTLKSRYSPPALITEVSGVVLALAPLCEREEVVLFNVGAQNPQIAGLGRFTFSNVNLADIESRQAAEFAFKTLAKRQAAILFAAASYGQGARDVFVSTFSSLGGRIVAETSYPPENTDYRAQITKIRESKPDVVYLPGTTQDMARVLRQSYEMGFRPQWLSYTAFEGEEILSLAGKAAEGVIFASAYLNWDSAKGLQAKFRDAYAKKYNKLPSVYAANSFDAFSLLVAAVLKNGPTGKGIRDYLITMPAFEGASGLTKFSDKGTVDKPLIFKVVRNGKFVRYGL